MKQEEDKNDPQSCRAACPVCGGQLIEIRAKLQCSRATPFARRVVKGTVDDFNEH